MRAQALLPQTAPSAIRNAPFINPSFGEPDQQSKQEENVPWKIKRPDTLAEATMPPNFSRWRHHPKATQRRLQFSCAPTASCASVALASQMRNLPRGPHFTNRVLRELSLISKVTGSTIAKK
jgi:hypothetical protein